MRGRLAVSFRLSNGKVEFEFCWKFRFLVQPIAEKDPSKAAVGVNLKINEREISFALMIFTTGKTRPNPWSHAEGIGKLFIRVTASYNLRQGKSQQCKET